MSIVNQNETIRQVKAFITALGKDWDTTVFWRKQNRKHFGCDKLEQNVSLPDLYFVTGNGGTKDKDITDCPTIFFEIDDRSISDQWDAIDNLRSLGLDPSLVVFTGGKSLHVYFVFDTPHKNIDEWKLLIKDLIAWQNADKACANPGRLMRVPGFKHSKTGNVSKIVYKSDARYSFEYIRSIVPQTEKPKRPEPKVKTKTKTKTNLTHLQATGIGIGIDPYTFLSREHKALVDCGIPTGQRFAVGRGLVMALRGIENAVNHAGSSLSTDPYQLWCDALADRDPTTQENTNLWDSASKADPSENVLQFIQKLNALDKDTSAEPTATKSEDSKKPESTDTQNPQTIVITNDISLTAGLYEKFLKVELKSFASFGYQKALPPKVEKYISSDLKKVILCIKYDKSTTPKKVKLAAWELKKKGLRVQVSDNGGDPIPCDDWIALTNMKLLKKPTKVIKQEDLIDGKYLPALDVAPRTKLIALKAPTGAGKTEVVGAYLNRECAKHPELTKLAVNCRVSVSEANANRWDINLASLLAETGVSVRASGSLGCCIHSFKYGQKGTQAVYKYDEITDPILIIDEVEHVIQDLLFSKLIEKDRIEIMLNLALTIQQAAKSPHGKIIIMDADLSDSTIDLIQALSHGLIDQHNTEIITCPVSNKKGRQAKIYPNKETLLASIEEKAERGEKVILHLTSQREKSKWSTRTIEQYLCEKFHDKRIIRIDSDTTRDPNHPAYGGVKNIDQLCETHDIIIVSPVIETGISIDEKDILDTDKIDHVFGIFSGVSAPQQALQTLARVRSNVPRHIFCCTRSNLNQKGSGSSNPWALDLNEKAKDTTNTTAITKSKKLIDATPYDSNIEQFAKAWNVYGAFHNAAKKNFKRCILTALEHDEYTFAEVTPIDDAHKDEIKEWITNIHEGKIYNPFLGNVSRADIAGMDDAQYQNLKDQEALTQAEVYQIKKFAIHKSFDLEPEDITPEVVDANENQAFSMLQNHFWLTVGFDMLSEREHSTLFWLNYGYQMQFIPDLNKKRKSGKIEALKDLNIDELIQSIESNPDKLWDEFDPELVKIQQKVLANLWDYRTRLGSKISSSEKAIQVVKPLLAMVGYRMESVARFRLNGKQYSRYQITRAFKDCLDRESIFKSWLEKHQEAIDEYHENLEAGQRIAQEGIESQESIKVRQERISENTPYKFGDRVRIVNQKDWYAVNGFTNSGMIQVLNLTTNLLEIYPLTDSISETDYYTFLATCR